MKRYLTLVLSFFICFFAGSCASHYTKSTLDILCELTDMANCGVKGETCLYSSLAEESEVGYFSQEMRISLYGEKRVTECFSLIEECAVYVSANEIKEIAVFKCYSRSDTDLVAVMCLERADTLSVALNTIYALNKNQMAHVEIHGKYVLFSFADQSQSLIKHFRELT